MTDSIWFSWGEVFNASLKSLWMSFIQFTPKLILAIVFFIVGWVIASIVSKAISQVFASLKVDKLFYCKYDVFLNHNFRTYNRFQFYNQQNKKLNFFPISILIRFLFYFFYEFCKINF